MAKTQTITRLALLTALALTLGYAENWINIAPGLPGVKLGLSNTTILYALYLMDHKKALLLMFLKVILSGILYAGAMASIFSLSGGIMSLAAMILVKKIGKDTVSIIGVSVSGAVFHNIGQMLAALFFVNKMAVVSYIPILIVSAVITGILTGTAALYTLRALKKSGLS